MERKTNCPNCGAALPEVGGKCEFCGTRVVDLTMLDFDAREPTMFLLNLPQSITGGFKATISMWAQPVLESMIMENDDRYCYNHRGDKLAAFTAEQQVAFEVSLHPCAAPNDLSLFKLKVDN